MWRGARSMWRVPKSGPDQAHGSGFDTLDLLRGQELQREKGLPFSLTERTDAPKSAVDFG